MVSRLLPLTIRPIQTRFRFGYETLHLLTLPEKVTRRFIMQKARSHSPRAAPTACRQTGSGSIALLCSRFFSPFPHGTGSLSVSREYLALRDGPRRFTQDFTCPALLRILLTSTKVFGYTAFMLYGWPFQTILLTLSLLLGVLQPQSCRNNSGLGCSPFARHY